MQIDVKVRLKSHSLHFICLLSGQLTLSMYTILLLSLSKSLWRLFSLLFLLTVHPCSLFVLSVMPTIHFAQDNRS